jgi:hypothetical protein
MLKSLWLGRLALSCGVQTRGSNGVNPTWLGFSYGSWWPRVRVQRNPRYVPSISAYWLCFHASADLWPKGVGNWGVL